MFKFQAVGKDLKTVAKIIATINFFIFLIAGLILFFLGLSGETDMSGLFVVSGIIIVCVGYLLSKLISIFLYGYGELIDCVMNIRDTLKREDRKTPNGERHSEVVVNAAEQHKNAAEQHMIAPGKPMLFPDGAWICTCGRMNTKIHSSCACGQSKRNIKF